MTAPKKIPFEQTPNRQINSLQTKINDATSVLRNGPMGDGVLLTKLVVPYSEYNMQSFPAPSYVHPTSRPTIIIVDHGLDRAYNGFIVCRLIGTAPAAACFPYEVFANDFQQLFDATLDVTRQIAFAADYVTVPQTYPIEFAVWVY